MRIGVDAVMGCGRDIFLLKMLIHHLQLIGRVTLNLIDNPLETTLRGQAWLKEEDMGLEGELAQVWKTYLAYLKREHIKLNNEDDELIRYLSKVGGMYTTKLGYSTLFVHGKEGNKW